MVAFVATVGAAAAVVARSFVATGGVAAASFVATVGVAAAVVAVVAAIVAGCFCCCSLFGHFFCLPR